MCGAFAALAFAGCGAATREERPAPAALLTTAAPAPASRPAEAVVTTNSATASEELTKACRALAAVKSFRALMTTSGGDDATVETRTEAALPDRFHVYNADYELIIVGTEVYRKLPGGSWQASPTGLAITSLTDPKKLEEYIKSAQVAPVGTETLDGSPVRVYQAAAPRSPARKSVHDDPDPFLMKIWVGISDGLPRRLEGTVLGTQTKTSVVYYDYNAKLAVNKPAGRR
jgi:hypothetical protein